MKKQGIFLPLPGWDASPSQGKPLEFTNTYLNTWVERGIGGVMRPTQEHKRMTWAGLKIWIIWLI